MDLTTPVLNGAMLALFTTILAWLGKQRFDALDSRMDRLDGRMDRLDSHMDRLDSRLDQLGGKIAQLRSDILQVALAAQPRPRTG